MLAGVLTRLVLAAALCGLAGCVSSFSPAFGGAFSVGHAEAAVADDVYSPAFPSDTGIPYPGTGSVLPHEAPGQLASRFVELVSDAYVALASVALPVAMLAMLVSCIVLIVGKLLGAQVVFRYGWGGLLTSCLGLLVYYSIPLIVALIRTVTARLS